MENCRRKNGKPWEEGWKTAGGRMENRAALCRWMETGFGWRSSSPPVTKCIGFWFLFFYSQNYRQELMENTVGDNVSLDKGKIPTTVKKKPFKAPQKRVDPFLQKITKSLRSHENHSNRRAVGPGATGTARPRAAGLWGWFLARSRSAFSWMAFPNEMSHWVWRCLEQRCQ